MLARGALGLAQLDDDDDDNNKPVARTSDATRRQVHGQRKCADGRTDGCFVVVCLLMVCDQRCVVAGARVCLRTYTARTDVDVAQRRSRRALSLHAQVVPTSDYWCVLFASFLFLFLFLFLFFFENNKPNALRCRAAQRPLANERLSLLSRTTNADDLARNHELHASTKTALCTRV